MQGSIAKTCLCISKAEVWLRLNRRTIVAILQAMQSFLFVYYGCDIKARWCFPEFFNGSLSFFIVWLLSTFEHSKLPLKLKNTNYKLKFTNTQGCHSKIMYISIYWYIGDICKYISMKHIFQKHNACANDQYIPTHNKLCETDFNFSILKLWSRINKLTRALAIKLMIKNLW